MKRSKCNLSHYRLLTGDMGELLPIGVVEVLPGDTIQHATSMLTRATPLATPPMHPVQVKVHHWYVPTRLIWTNFEDFITGGADGNDNTTAPTIALTNPAEGSLADYLGIPSGTYSPTVSALPFRAYSMIWNEWYRDQDLMTEVTVNKGDGADATTNTSLKFVAWEKDRFTSARPWEQKGTAVTLPLGTSAPVTGTATGDAVFRDATGGGGSVLTITSDGSTAVMADQANKTITSRVPGIAVTGTADLSTATAASVNTIREAFALQRFQEARARYGSRFTEYLRYLGVRSSDARLQRPEYLGGGKQTLQFSEVLQTASTTADVNGVGQLYGHGIAGLRSRRYRRFFEEHGFVISLAYVLPRTMYPQGLNRMWNRPNKEDYWQKELEHIGQAPVYNREIYALDTGPGDVFGYQDRYDEYRRQESSIHGEFRSTMNDWHFGRIFSGDVTLNSSFVTSNPAKRPFQSQSTDVLLMLCHHQMVARRLVAREGTSFIY